MSEINPIISPLQAAAVAECLKARMSFALFVMPGESSARFMASVPEADGRSRAHFEDSGEDCFFICRFADDDPCMPGVTAAMDEGRAIEYLAANPDKKFPVPDEKPSLTSTHQASYESAFHLVRKRIRRYGGKGVVSRLKAVTSNRDIVETAEEYFRANPSTFRYIAFTHETGLWLGATPEVFIEYTYGADRLGTMALAGTLPRGGASVKWDEKNILEHQIVVDFLVSEFGKAGLKAHVGKRTDLTAGVLTHLCTPVTASGVTSKAIPAIINRLNPTPAVAGWPRDTALAEIDRYEAHQRRCYAGIVGVRLDGRLHAFVNLRCAFVSQAKTDGRDTWLYNLYAGGGIMGASELDDEWEETERKMQLLLSCIDPNGHTAIPIFSFNPIENTVIQPVIQ